MPDRQQQQLSHEERLSQLIRLKSLEKPDQVFWNRFDTELRSKQLAALVRTQNWFQRSIKLSFFLVRKTAAVSAAVSVFAFALFAVIQMDFLAKRDSLETSPPATHYASSELPDTPTFEVIEDDVSAIDVFVDPSSVSGDAVYQINALTRRYQPAAFRLVASPMELKAQHAADSAGATDVKPSGTRILKAGRQF